MSIASFPRVQGRLHLHFTHDQQRACTILRTCEQEPPLRVVHAFPRTDGSTLLHLHNQSGGVLGGDHLSLHVHLEAHTRVQLTTTSATRVYRCHPDRSPARQTTVVHVGAHGLLEYLPDQLIPFADARYQQHTRIELEADAGLFWWETVAPGRLARGECFAYEQLHLETAIFAENQPIASERMKLEPRRVDLTSPARLGSFRYVTSFFLCRVGLPPARWHHREERLSELAQQHTRADTIVWGVSSLVAHGLLVRALSQHSHDIAPGLLAFWREAKQHLYQEEAILPRKIY